MSGARAIGGEYNDDQALREAEAAVRANPGDPNAHLALGFLRHVRGELDEAARVYRGMLAIFPAHSEACFRLANIERSRGNRELAIDLYRRAAGLRPGFWEAHGNLGLVLEEAGRPHEALPELTLAIRCAPGQPELYYNLGISLTALGRLEEAVASYRQAVVLHPSFAEAHNNLGATLKTLGRLDDAGAAFRTAIALRPDWAGAHSNLGGVHEWQGLHDEALAGHRRAIALAPDAPEAHANYLFTLLFHPGYDALALRREHAEWNRRHAAPLASAAVVHDNDRTPSRRLRIGYVGGHFRDHVVGRNLLPLMREHDREAVEVFCYSSQRLDDALTESFRHMAAGWRDIRAMSDGEAAALIRRDRIDILVDTALHMEGNRLLVFARRPAPIQVTFAGYPGSTGLTAIDYRLSDVHLDPPGEHDTEYAEATWRLPETFWCYDPLGADVSVGALPAATEGRIAFGCLNNFSKVNAGVLELWARVLAAVPDSRLIVLSHEGSHRQRARDVLARLGIEASRLEFVGYRSRTSYLELFRRLDISLDTVPYNGHTTSLDSLWMGVPVLTLVGGTVVGRAGLCQLQNLGLPDWIAATPQDYVSLATRHAADLPRLMGLRGALRSRMERSALMDAKRFARNVESAYGAMWRRWCHRRG